MVSNYPTPTGHLLTVWRHFGIRHYQDVPKVRWAGYRMKLYLAAPFEELERLRIIMARVLLETPQHEVVSSWLKEPLDGPVLSDDGTWPMLALRDLAELRVCNVLILDTFSFNDRGGSQAEYGFATALGKQVWVVGPIRNVFNSIAQRKFKNWDQVLDILKTYQ